MTTAEHRAEALRLLAKSTGYGKASPAFTAAIAEAQLHATLALSSEPEPVVEAPAVIDKPAPARKTAAKTPKSPTPAAG